MIARTTAVLSGLLCGLEPLNMLLNLSITPEMNTCTDKMRIWSLLYIMYNTPTGSALINTLKGRFSKISAKSPLIVLGRAPRPIANS